MAELAKPTATRLRKPSWRDTRLIVGVVIVILSMTVGAKAIAAADDTLPMYAAVSALVPGQPVTQRDVRRVEVQLGADRVRYVAADHDIAPDTVALREVRPGELVPSSALGPRSAIDLKPVSVPVDSGTTAVQIMVPEAGVEALIAAIDQGAKITLVPVPGSPSKAGG